MFMENFESLFNNSQYDISVSGQQLADISIKLKSLCKDLILNISDVTDIIKTSERYWVGTSSQNLIELLKDASYQTKTVNERFNKQMNNLSMIISVYDNSEKKQINDSTTLSGSILE